MKIYQIISLISSLFILSISVHAQSEQLIILDEAQAPQAIYQIYLGKIQPGQSIEQFSDASHLGFLRTFSIEEPPVEQGPSRAYAEQKVYLGPFIGHETAKEIMEKILDLGYIDAYLESDPEGLKTPAGHTLNYSVQIGAFEKLNMNKFSRMANVPAHGVFVLYEDGMYKVLSGLYPETEKDYLRKSVVPYLNRTWGINGFVRSVDLGQETP